MGRRLRDAPSDRRRSSFAFPVLRRFHILSCHARPDRRGSIRSITDRLLLLRSSPGRFPRACLAVGLPGNRPGGIPAAFPCSAFITGWVRSTLYTGGASFASGHVRRPDPDRWPYFGLSLEQPRLARSFDDACECLISLTVPSDSSAAPGLRLPGWLHCREGFRPWTVALPPPVQRLLPWNTCRERQGLVRLPMLSSDECDFMSQLTWELTDRSADYQ